MKTIYWSSTLIIAGFLFFSAFTYFFHQPTINGIKALGFPSFFRVQLAVLKIIGAVVLLLPAIPLQFKEWAYSGVGLFLITAFIAHLAHKDPFVINLLLLLFFSILIVSNVYLHKVMNM